MHQLHRIAIGQCGVAETRAPDDLPVELDYHGAGVEAQMPEQVGRGSGTGDAPGLPVYQDLELGHVSLVQGKSMARVAAAGSAAIQSPLIAATPYAPAAFTSAARSGVIPPMAITGRPRPAVWVTRV
jgi:hypothetical protein